MKETDFRSVLVVRTYIYRLKSFSSTCLQGDVGNVTPKPFCHGTPLISLLVHRYKYKSHLSEQPHDPSITLCMGQRRGDKAVFLGLSQTAQATLSAWTLPRSVGNRVACKGTDDVTFLLSHWSPIRQSCCPWKYGADLFNTVKHFTLFFALLPC